MRLGDSQGGVPVPEELVGLSSGFFSELFGSGDYIAAPVFLQFRRID